MTIQMNLFDDAVEKLELFKAVDDIKNQFGSKAVVKAVTSQLTEGASYATTRHNRKKTTDRPQPE